MDFIRISFLLISCSLNRLTTPELYINGGYKCACDNTDVDG